MTTLTVPHTQGPAPIASTNAPRLTRWISTVIVWLSTAAVIATMSLALGANPLTMVASMLDSSVLSFSALGQTLLRAVPIGLAALAVAVPARAGLVNVGGEGQLIVGAIAATGIGLWAGDSSPGPLALAVTALAGALAGAIWSAICGVLRVWLHAPEAVTTLLMNLIANDIMLYLIYQPWKDPSGSGQPQSRLLPSGARLEQWSAPLAINTGVLLAVVVAIAIGMVMDRTTWGFTVKVTGSNPEAARRMGLPTKRLMVGAMALGGSLAGLGGALNLMGVEGQLRPGITTTFGYTAFMACFISKYRPMRVLGVALVFSAIVLSGNGLQIDQGLDGNFVTVILGLIVLAYLLAGHSSKGADK